MIDTDGLPVGELFQEVGFRREFNSVYFIRDGDIWRCPVEWGGSGSVPGTPELLIKVAVPVDRRKYIYWIDINGDLWREARGPRIPAPNEDPEVGHPTLLYTLFPLLKVPAATVHIQIVASQAERIFASVTSKADLNRISDRDLELLLGEVFRKEGYETYVTPKSHDGGRDIIAAKPGPIPILFIAEAKKMDFVKPTLVHSLAGVMGRDHANLALLATTGRFSANTRNETLSAWGTRLQLKDGDELAKWIQDLKRSARP